MIVKTLKEVPQNVIDEAYGVYITYLPDDATEVSDRIHFAKGHMPEDKNQWYKITEMKIGDDKKTPVSVSEMMKILKQKYTYYKNNDYYFGIEFFGNFGMPLYVTPKPNPEICGTWGDKEMKGHRTRAPAKKSCPVKVNFRGMI